MEFPGVSATKPTRVGHFRWLICALLFLATTVNYLPLFIIASLAYLIALFLIHRLNPRLEPMLLVSQEPSTS